MWHAWGKQEMHKFFWKTARLETHKSWRHNDEDTLKWILDKWVMWIELPLDMGRADFCEHYNEISGPLKVESRISVTCPRNILLHGVSQSQSMYSQFLKTFSCTCLSTCFKSSYFSAKNCFHNSDVHINSWEWGTVHNHVCRKNSRTYCRVTES